MAEQKEKGVPFALALNTRPRQYGLTGFSIVRYVLGTAAGLPEPEDITASTAIEEFENTVVAPYTGSPTVSVQGFAKSDRIGVHDPAKELQSGHIVEIGTTAYAVLAVSVDGAGEGYIDLALPLRADIAADTPITLSGRTGNYRITVTEDTKRSVQYKIAVADAYPHIELDSQVLDIITTDDVLIDNSKLLL